MIGCGEGEAMLVRGVAPDFVAGLGIRRGCCTHAAPIRYYVATGTRTEWSGGGRSHTYNPRNARASLPAFHLERRRME